MSEPSAEEIERHAECLFSFRYGPKYRWKMQSESLRAWWRIQAIGYLKQTARASKPLHEISGSAA